MKYLIIFLLGFNFCLADKAKPAKYWRQEIRMPYTGSLPCKHRNHGDHKCSTNLTITNLTIPTFLHPKQIAQEKRWITWWQDKTCFFIDSKGTQRGCKKKADNCSWLKEQKDSIKKQWTLTSQKKTIKLVVYALPVKGSGFGWKLIDK